MISSWIIPIIPPGIHPRIHTWLFRKMSPHSKLSSWVLIQGSLQLVFQRYVQKFFQGFFCQDFPSGFFLRIFPQIWEILIRTFQKKSSNDSYGYSRKGSCCAIPVRILENAPALEQFSEPLPNEEFLKEPFWTKFPKKKSLKIFGRNFWKTFQNYSLKNFLMSFWKNFPMHFRDYSRRNLLV